MASEQKPGESAMLRTVAFAALVLVAAVARGQSRTPLLLLRARPQADLDEGNRGQYVDSIGQLARQPLGRWQDSPGCQPNSALQRQRMKQQARIAYGQRMRQAELSRRQASREHLPPPLQDREKLAAGKVQLAHLFWQSGKREAARMVLFNVPVDFPRTAAADEARNVLDRIDRLQLVAVR